MSYDTDQAMKATPEFVAQERVYRKAELLFDNINEEYAQSFSRWQERNESATSDAVDKARKSLRAQTDSRLNGVIAWYERETSKFGDKVISWNEMTKLVYPGDD